MVNHIYSENEIVSHVAPLLQKYHAESAILFGSYARREATQDSDVDLVVIGGAGFDPTDVFCIADELYCRLGKNVDVYELSEINVGTDFYNTIFREGVRITSCNTALHSVWKRYAIRRQNCWIICRGKA